MVERTADEGSRADRELMDALFSPSGRDDPQTAMQVRPTMGCRYDVVEAVLRDRATAAPAMPPSDRPLFGLLGRFMARLDGERHHEVRAHFARIFTPRRTSAYEGLIRDRARALLDAMESNGTGDLVSDFARPLPFGVISDVLGVPVADQPWLESTMSTMSGAFAGQRDPAQVDRGDEAVVDLLGYFDAAITERAGAARHDLLSTLAAAVTAGVSRDDLVANCVFFLLAGHATTTTLLAAGAALLSERPEDLACLRADPTRWEPAVEELLRFISPISITGVGLPEDVVVGEDRFLAGPNRLLCFAAANRDPAVFADPHRLDIGRDPNRHLAFSVGAHHCLGAPLARLHGRIGLHELFQRLPGLRVDGEPIWRGGAPVRQLERMPVTW